ncbi:hypothetical protein AVEN_212550-1 [Araneus ventricosus]|uniref:Uncharacterized protein n=1 Tax=Araneus ventricosus TaxID=182803 RepID=A0A4Y2PBC4_ARAVE|nr:hypothetical protein AVEN_212550-1 [Araneus ventricosus]
MSTWKQLDTLRRMCVWKNSIFTPWADYVNSSVHVAQPTQPLHLVQIMWVYKASIESPMEQLEAWRGQLAAQIWIIYLWFKEISGVIPEGGLLFA